MASRSETIAGQAIRKMVADLNVGADIAVDEIRRTAFSALELFLPDVLTELYDEWQRESLDGFYPIRLRKVGDREIELFGLCILISDQALAPIYLQLQLDPTQDEISWLILKLGEKLQDRGERGATMQRTPYSSLDSALTRIYRLGEPDQIDWAYKVTFGEKR